jgi:hypothetical protein
MLKKIVFIWILLLVTGNASMLLAQQQVVATSGGEGTVNGINLQWTLGECVVASTEILNNIQLTQGFQQPAYKVEIIEDNTTEIAGFSGVKVFPIPATDYLTIDFDTEVQVNYVAILTDIDGKTVLKEELAGSENRIDMQQFPASVYVLTISDNNGKFLKSFKITKQ